MDNVDINFRMMASGNAVPELRKAQNGVKRLGDQIDRSQARMRGFNNGITKMQANTRKFSMGVLQQAGYQFGDYAVQVANGTSKMQAFGQQAPQLLQIFGPIGAIVGAGVAIFSAFAVAIERTSKVTKDASDPVDRLTSALQSLEGLDYDGLAEDMSKPAQKVREEFSGVLSLIRDVAEAKREAALGDIMSKFSPLEDVIELNERVREATRLANEATFKNTTSPDKLDRLNKIQSELASELRAELNTRQILLGINGKTRLEVAASLEAAKAQLESSGLLTDELHDQLGLFAQQARLQSAIEDQVKRSVNTSEAEKEEILEAQNKVIQEMNDHYVGQDAIFRSLSVKQGNMALLAEEMRDAVKARSEFLSDEDEIMSQLVVKSTILAKNLSVAGGRGQDPRQFSYLDEFREQLEKLSGELDKPAKKVRKLAKTINSDLSPAMKQLQTVQESVSSSFENGFMSIIDGTSSVKDAFKSMASEIIKELYRIFVVKKITGMISGFFNMNQVSGPTMPLGTGNIRPQMRPTSFSGGGYTGSGARAGGLDGKGGFMAMIHPRETVVDHTKGQGTGGVTVIQNNTFQSGVTRSEVSALLPKMVEASKAAVLDAKRQGGSYGKAFA